MVSGVFRYRAFIIRHALADLRHRYAGSGMGIAWNVIHPLAIIAIYSCVFRTIFPSQNVSGGGKLPYTIYLCAGFFPWLAFSECVGRGCSSFLINAAHLKKIPLPEQVFVAQSAAASTLNLTINFSLLLIVAAALGWRPNWTWLLLPIPLILLQILGFAIGLLLGTLNVFFRDIAEWVTIGLQLLMWSLPIVYRLNPEPGWLRLHPLMPSIDAIRTLFLNDQTPPAHDWIGMIVWPIIALLGAVAVLNKLRPEIRDLI